MVFKTSFTLLVAIGTAPFFAVVSIISDTTVVVFLSYEHIKILLVLATFHKFSEITFRDIICNLKNGDVSTESYIIYQLGYQ